MKQIARIFLAITLSAVSFTGALAQEASGWLGTSSLIGESKYGNSFTHYDHVNPDAPKGGTVNLIAIGTYDSFNPYIVRGSSAAGFAPSGLGGGFLYDTLMAQSVDEPSTSHALLAEAYTYPADYSFAIYRLDKRAKWHDGKPITPEDVVWTFDFLKKESQLYIAYYANVTSAEVLNETDIKFTFDQKNNRELPQILGDMPVLPKHWWESTDAKGNKRDVTQPTLEPPLGSGPYKVGAFNPGSSITWDRVADYWGKDVGTNVGRWNFDQRIYTYFRDDTPAWEAFKKGGIEDFRAETRSARWAEGYNFPAVTEGKVKRKAFATTAPQPMQGFSMNMRRAKFADVRVRKALSYLYDFETMNRIKLFGLRQRTSSYFPGGELASSGVPQGRELEILEKFRADLPADLFTTEYKNPIGGDRDLNRSNQREAAKLFREAGWEAKNGKWVNAAGEIFSVEILGASEVTNIIAGQFVEDMRQFGIEASIRIIDSAQYVARLEEFDFDMTTVVLAQSLSPGNEQRDFWTTKAADSKDSRNMSGIKSPVIDALVDTVIFAKDREELVAATHALDRVLLWNHFYIPQYYSPEDWAAWWDKFEFRDNQPSYAGYDFHSWWAKSQ